MTVHRFYVPDLDRHAGTALLSTEQSRQVSRVLRLRTGDTVCVFDGSGAEFDATLVEERQRQWSLELGAEYRPEREPATRLTVGLALLRNERFDMAVQKLTELGVAGIAPVAAERCVISYADARSWEKRRARIQRIIVEAAEQSEHTTLPVIHEPQSVDAFLAHSTGMETFALVERHATDHINLVRPGAAAQALLVGPEGGWTPGELERIDEAARPISLGRLILRSETAAIAGASYLLLSSAERGSPSGE